MRALVFTAKKISILLTYVLIGLTSARLVYADSILNNHDDTYYFGVYLYSDFFEAAAKEQKKDYFQFLDEHLANLAAHSVNCAHLTITDPQQFDTYLQLAQKHGIKLLPQLNFAYFKPSWTPQQMQKNADRAVGFLKKWKDSPQVLAWSVKEEPYPDEIVKLEKYYDSILSKLPDLKLFITCHWASSLAKISSRFHFKFVGGDYYYFGWDQSDQNPAGKPHLRTPREALDLTRDITTSFFDAGKKHNADYFHVFPCASCLDPVKAQGLADGTTLPVKWTEKQKNQYRENINKLAMAEQDGWSRFPDKNGYLDNLGKMYMPPENCLKAMAWSGVLNGAKMSMCFMYVPCSKKYCPNSPEDSVRNYRREIFSMNLADRSNKPTPYLDEFAEAGREIRSYGKIIKRWTQSPEPLVVTNAKKYIFNKAFDVEGIPGKAILILNSDVGTLLCDRCKTKKNQCDHMYIDQQGKIKYFHPFAGPQKVTFSFLKNKAPAKGTGVFCVDSGLELKPNGDLYEITIKPGAGKILFVGTSENAAGIHKLYLSSLMSR